MYKIPERYIVHDLRSPKDFSKLTISGYKNQDVVNAYQNSMINNKLEDAIRWCVELHSSGLDNNIWKCFYVLIIKYIHVNNPKLFVYLKKREKEYKNIISKYNPKFYYIHSKNNQEIRNMFAELTSICCLTKKNNIFLQNSLPKLGQHFFDKNNLSKRMISKNIDNIIEYFNDTTTKEIKLGLNEIYSNIESRNGTFDNCLYWYLWLEKVEQLKKKEIKNNNNNISFDENEVKEDDLWVFTIWKIINKHTKKINDNDNIFIKKLYDEYSNNFKISDINKKKYLLFIAFNVLKKKVNWSISLYQQEYLLLQVIGNINKMYEQIKVNNETNLNESAKNILYKNFNVIFYEDYNINSVKIKEPIKINDNSINPESQISFTKYPEYEQISKKKVEFINNSNLNNSNKNNLLKKKNNNNENENEKKQEFNFRHKINNEFNLDYDNDNDNEDDNNSYNNDSDENYESYDSDDDKKYKNKNKELIGKGATKDDLQRAKEERMIMKIDAFKQLITIKKPKNNEITKEENNIEELKRIELIKKRKNDN
jgi:hypothetical protein